MKKVTIEELKTNLNGSSPVNFSYEKADGTTCNAKGTLNLKLIPTLKHPKNESVSRNEKLDYFDLNKDGWRSVSLNCKTINLV